MPLTKLGKQIEKNFEKQYGKTEGKRVFHAWEKKNKTQGIVKGGKF